MVRHLCGPRTAPDLANMMCALALMAGAATDSRAATQSDEFPAPIARELQERKGICLDLNCGDGKLAAAIARSSELVVFGLAGDDRACGSAREVLEKAGLHGSRATVAVGSARRIPLPNGYCNLIVAGQLPPEIDFREIARVLNPSGVAVVGGANADAGRLKSRAAQAGISDCKTDGTYLVIRGRMPEGSDDWAHIHRGPDNNRVSLDESIRPPLRTQWLASAYGWMLAAEGRVLIKPWIMGHSTVKTHRFLVRDGQNGAVLWEHEARDRGVWAADTVMTASKVYTIDARNSIAVLDAGTGKELATFKAPAGSDAECAGWYSTAYFAAGMCSIDGVYLYAIDASTGQMRWVKEIGHLSDTPKADNGITGLHGFVGISPYGALALGRDLLYVPNGRCRPGVFRKTDGEVVGWPGLYERANHTGGSEVVVAGDEIFNGGGGLIGTGWDDLIGYDPENPFRPYHASSGQSYAKETLGNYSLDLRYATPASTASVTYIIRRASLLAYRREKLAAVYPLSDKDKAAAVAEATLWTTTKIPDGAHSIATAGPQVLVAGTSEVAVLDETGQERLARFRAKGKILRNGLSVAHGKAYVVTEEGSVVCLGAE